MKKIEWCFKIKNGLKLVEPNEIVSDSYLEQSEKALSKVKFLIEENDFVWANSRMYYCVYYSIMSFLYKIGVKSENHDCSIEVVKFLFGETFGADFFKEMRVGSQYYFKFSGKEDLLKNYSQAKLFFLNFKRIIGSLDEKKVNIYRKKIRGQLNEN